MTTICINSTFLNFEGIVAFTSMKTMTSTSDFLYSLSLRIMGQYVVSLNQKKLCHDQLNRVAIKANHDTNDVLKLFFSISVTLHYMIKVS